MSSKDEALEPSSDSFWEVDSYKRVVKRTEDGFLLCNELMKMIQERAEIELKHSTKLKLWSKKWIENIDKSTEYGTNKSVLMSSLNEAEFLANIHNEMKEQLLAVVNDVKKWRNETYKKQMVGLCKEAKQFEEEFKKAQKPWAKYLGKFVKYRKEYEANVKYEKTLEGSLAGSLEEDKKLNDRLDKCRKETENILDKLETTHKDLNTYKPVYIADMTEVFEKTQEFEEKRLNYFKNTLINMHKCLDISQNDKIPLIYIQWRKSIELSDSKKDLKWWSQTYGADMSMNWPNLNDLNETNGNVLKSNDPSDKISQNSDNLSISSTSKIKRSPTLPVKNNQQQQLIQQQQRHSPITNVVVKPVVRPESVVKPAVVKDKEITSTSYDVKLNPFSDEDGGGETNDSISPLKGTTNTTTTTTSETIARKISYDPELNPFEDEEKEIMLDQQKLKSQKDQSNNNKSKSSRELVVAIYDYIAQEEDELTFKKGDVFEKLDEKDDQGWCTGRKDGLIGLYPEKFVKSFE